MITKEKINGETIIVFDWKILVIALLGWTGFILVCGIAFNGLF